MEQNRHHIFTMAIFKSSIVKKPHSNNNFSITNSMELIYSTPIRIGLSYLRQFLGDT